jgi:type IX secretion system PorP/SprF family membrane protein
VIKVFTTPRFFILICLLIWQHTALSAQDIHFSQFGNSPLNLNPAQAGVFGGDMRFVGNYRDQWRVKRNQPLVPYLTFSGSLENKIYFQPGRYDRFLTGSVLFNYDRQGDLRLTSFQVGFPVSLTLPVATGHFLTLGVTPMFAQRAINGNDWSFDAQWFDCMYNPGASIREDQLVTSDAIRYFDLAAGLNYRLQAQGTRTRLNFGAAMHHINRPYHDFWSASLNSPGQIRLYNKLSLHGQALIQATANMDLIGQAIHQSQGSYRQFVYGVAARLHLNRNPYKELALQVGVDMRNNRRNNDALIPSVTVLYKTWQLGLSYDANVWSDVERVTRGRSGPELSLIHRLYRVKPLPVFKTCPIM